MDLHLKYKMLIAKIENGKGKSIEVHVHLQCRLQKNLEDWIKSR